MTQNEPAIHRPRPPVAKRPVGSSSNVSAHRQQQESSFRASSSVNGKSSRSEPPIGERIKAVFQKMVDAVDDDDERAINVPEQMWDFYDTELMKHFLIAATNYFRAYTSLVKKEEDARPEPGVVRNNEEATPEELAAIEGLVAEQKKSMKLVAQHYSRIILHCSNFERSKEDEKFFECLYYFACVVLKSGTDVRFWDHLERELGFIFRGQFNINAHSGVDAGPATNHAEPTARLTAPQNPRAFGVGLQADTRKMEREHREMIMRVADNLDLSSQLRDEMDRKAFDMRKLEKQRNITLYPPAVSIGRSAMPGAKKPKFSIHKALHARSPVISLLLPTAKAQQTIIARRCVLLFFLLPVRQVSHIAFLLLLSSSLHLESAANGKK
jgi:hypothetical protein